MYSAKFCCLISLRQYLELYKVLPFVAGFHNSKNLTKNEEKPECGFLITISSFGAECSTNTKK